MKFQTTSFFKPTRDFNADDVLFTFNRMLDPNQPFRKAYPASFPYFTDMGLNKLITKVEAVDPYTVKFTLKEINAPFIQNMARICIHPVGRIRSATAESGQGFGHQPVSAWHGSVYFP